MIFGRELNGRERHSVQAEGLATFGTTEMDMLILVAVFLTIGGRGTNGKLHGPRIVDHPVDQSLLFERLQGAVNGHPIKFADPLLNFCVSEGIRVVEKQIQYRHADLGLANVVVGQQ
jgi:hypothetical protein